MNWSTISPQHGIVITIINAKYKNVLPTPPKIDDNMDSIKYWDGIVWVMLCGQMAAFNLFDKDRDM